MSEYIDYVEHLTGATIFVGRQGTVRVREGWICPDYQRCECDE